MNEVINHPSLLCFSYGITPKEVYIKIVLEEFLHK